MSEHDHAMHRGSTLSGERETMSSEDLAALIVDALLRAGVVNVSDVKRAVMIAAEEIDARKNLGDY